MQETQIVEQLNSIANNWDNFKLEYKHMKAQVSDIQTALNRPGYGNMALNTEKSIAADYLRKGEIKMELKDQFSSAADSGGGLILPTLSNEIVSNMQALSPIRRLASVDNISSNELDIIVEDQEFETGWVSEIEARKETKTPKLKQKKILVHELYAQPMATQRLIDDSSIDMYSWISQRLSEYFSRIENYAFIHGDGDNKPKGILTEQNVKVVKTAKKTTISIEDILKLMNELGEYYMNNASFVMHRSTLSYIQTLKDATGRFIWQPSYNDQKPQTLFGIPLYCCEDMPTMAEDKKVIALGDFKSGYKIVDRQGINIMRDPYTHKPFVKFYAVKRVGGEVIQPAAIKLLEC
jgi:HK97 family phage major capsid protein